MSIASFDVIVVGAGPAGLTAATGAARAGLKALCLDKLAPGGALINLAELHEVEGHGDGPQIALQLTDEATEAGVELGFGEVVKLTGPSADLGPWTVETADGESHTGRTVVIATGLSKGTLGLPEEVEYDGRGLSHCASCDGPLYAGRPVVVAGTEGWAPREAAELRVVAGDVTVIGKAAAQLPDGVHHLDGRIVALEGADGLESVVVETSSGSGSESGGTRKTNPASAVFVYVGQSPAAEFLAETLARDATGHIVVDEGCRTSAATAFAVGDVRAGARHYLADAIADGQRAGQAIIKALA
jgi:thioredoxin reductase (NADPH)